MECASVSVPTDLLHMLEGSGRSLPVCPVQHSFLPGVPKLIPSKVMLEILFGRS